MSRANPKFLGQGGRRSLSDVHVGKSEEYQRRGASHPTRTVSLASPGTRSYLPLGDCAPIDLQKPRISTSRTIPQTEIPNINDPQRTEYETQIRRASGASSLPDEASEHQKDSSIGLRKENVAPIVSQPPRADLANSTAKEANTTIEGWPTRPSTPYPISSGVTGRISRESIEISHRLTDDPNRSTTSLSFPLREELVYSLQSMYGNLPSDLTSKLEFLRAIEDPFDAKYTTAFDVFYNTRRFFDGHSGTVLDATPDKHPIGSGTVSGKSIYGIFIDDSLLCEGSTIMEPQTFIRPAFIDTDFLRRRILQSSVAGSSGSDHKVSFQQKSLTIPSRRLHRPQLSESVGYNSLPRRRKVAGRDIITSPIRLRPTFRMSPPRSPSFGMRKKTSTLRPKAVMAWWKEREAAISRTDTFGRGITKTHFNEQPKISPPNGGPEKKKEKEKRRNPLRRLSSLFGKRQSSESSLRSTTRSNGSHRSLNSLPSQVSLPECRQGIPSFITTNIVRNSRVPSSAGENIEVTKARQISGSSSVVQQRISSFEAPRPIRIEKKYQTSPSYQLLSTLKPVRGRSLKDRFEKELGSGTEQTDGVNGEAVSEDLPARAWEADTQQAPVTSPSLSGHETSVSTCQMPAAGISILDISSGSDSIQLDSHPADSSPFVEDPEDEGNDRSMLQEIYDAEPVLSSPDFSDPQIVTSTPLLNSGLSSPLIPQSISLLRDSRSIHGLNSSFDSSINSNNRHNAILSRAAGATKSASSNILVPVQKSIMSTDDIYNTSTSMNSVASDDNKENIAPYEDLPNLPSISPHNTRRKSVSSILDFARGERNGQNAEIRFQGSLRRQSRGWQRRPLRMVKSALGSLGMKDANKTMAQDQSQHKKRRPSVLDLFKFSRSAEITNDTPTLGTPSFRVLPTVDSASLPCEVEAPIYKNRSILSMKLGRKKKPILVVPKYPKKDKFRGNLFGLFDFNKAPPKSSFVIHSDVKEKTGRKVSTGSNRTVSKITRRFSMNVFPIFKRRIFSAPPDSQSLPPMPVPIPRERSTSPPPQLELTLSGSGL